MPVFHSRGVRYRLSSFKVSHLLFNEATASLFIPDFNNNCVLRFDAPAAPTAASVSISGRVTIPQELGLTNALVTLTDMEGNAQTVVTGKFGSFRFTNVTAGETYILTVVSRRYTYAPQVVTATGDLTEVNFTAQ